MSHSPLLSPKLQLQSHLARGSMGQGWRLPPT